MGIFEDFWDNVLTKMLPSFKTRDTGVRSYFGIALKADSTLSLSEIRRIIDLTELSPLFISLDGEDAERHRALARYFDSRAVFPRSINEFSGMSGRCDFLVTEHLPGALFSFLSYTPIYLNVKDADSREFMGELAFRGIGGRAVMPYTKNRLDRIKKVGARDSDFYGILNFIRSEMKDSLRRLILPP